MRSSAVFSRYVGYLVSILINYDRADGGTGDLYRDILEDEGLAVSVGIGNDDLHRVSAAIADVLYRVLISGGKILAALYACALVPLYRNGGAVKRAYGSLNYIGN